jgi:predicted permease
VSLAEAQAAATAQSERLEQEFPETQKGQRALVAPEPRARTEAAALQYMPPIVTAFMTLVGLVLLVACANVANLLLARAIGRQKEMAIRAALGASRLRILRQSLVEGTLLALMGAGLGLLFAQWPIRALASVRPATDLPIQFHFDVDYRVFTFTLLLAVGAGLISGLLPGLRIAHTNLAAMLKEGGRTSSRRESRHRFRDLLVASQVAFSLVLLVCAGLFLRTTRYAARQDMGFDIQDRLIGAMDTDMCRYDEPRSRAFYRQLLERVRALPGVVAATTSAYLPVGFGSGMREILVEGTVPETGKPLPLAFHNIVQTDYFRAMGMPILKGRAFDDNDTESSKPVAVINQVMAEKMWPGRDPIGRRFSISGTAGPFLEVICVTRVVKFVLPAERPSPGYYLPFRQSYRSDQVLIVRTQGDPMRLVPAVRGEVQALDPDMPVWDVRTMEEHILRGKMILFHIATAIVTAFGLIGLALAAVGLYGVMAFLVGERTHEIGVRMALGASGASVLAMVLRQGLTKAGIGMAVGLVGAFGVARLLTNYLVGVAPTDPPTYAAVTLFLAAVAAAASLAPAVRATRVDPVVALRSE